jgi:hypothetical protein
MGWIEKGVGREGGIEREKWGGIERRDREEEQEE